VVRAAALRQYWLVSQPVVLQTNSYFKARLKLMPGKTQIAGLKSMTEHLAVYLSMPKDCHRCGIMVLHDFLYIAAL